jgi:hypothetical protein
MFTGCGFDFPEISISPLPCLPESKIENKIQFLYLLWCH